MSEHDDKPPAEVLRTKRLVTGAERDQNQCLARCERPDFSLDLPYVLRGERFAML